MNFKTNGFQSSVNENKNELTLEDYKKMFTPSSKLKREVSLFSAITLPLVLAACGGGGGLEDCANGIDDDCDGVVD